MKIKKLDLFSFKKNVDEGIPFIVKFKTNSCCLCTSLKSPYKKVAESIPDIQFYDVDADEESELSDLFIEDGVPTIYYIKGNKFKELDYPNEGYNEVNLCEIIKNHLDKEKI